MKIQVPTTVDKCLMIGEVFGSPYFIRPSDWANCGEHMVFEISDDISLDDLTFEYEVIEDE